MPSLVNARPLFVAEAVRSIPTLIYLFASMVNPLKVRVDADAELVAEGGSIS
jgi:predicted ribosome-associated RNA-binding protein Tma20